MFQDVLPIDLKAMVDNEIDRDERLLWSGQPKPSRFMLFSWILFILAIPGTVFAIVWMFSAAKWFGSDITESSFGWIFPLFGLAFLVPGLVMMTAPFWFKRRAKNTVYAVTSRRAIVFVKGLSTKVTSYEIRKLTNMTKKIQSDGSGDLLFNESSSFDSHGNCQSRFVGFWGVEDVNRVEDLIERTRQEQ